MPCRRVSAARCFALSSLVALGACQHQHPTAVENIGVSLASGEVYRLPTVGGDEEGALIITQARHFAISELRRDSTTDWVSTYIYQPAAGFTGRDAVEIEVFSGTDPAAPSEFRRLRIDFDVH